jgi:hypothetical protein
MMVNSGNRKTISNIVKVEKGLNATESRNIKNWVGMRIELYFDPNVKMLGQMVGGIKVKTTSPIPDISDMNALTILNLSTTLEELQSNWKKLSAQEQSLPTVNALKDKLKADLK